MGGIGSGRQGGFHRTNGYQKLSISGATRKTPLLGKRIRLGPQYPDSILQTSVGTFALDWTPCNLGGSRPWFLCRQCGRRTSVLYTPSRNHTPDWRCRKCHQVEYACQYTTPLSKDIARTWRLAKKLELDALVAPGAVTRPHGMHRKTFQRLLAEYRSAHARLMGGLDTYISKEHDALEKIANL